MPQRISTSAIDALHVAMRGGVIQRHRLEIQIKRVEHPATTIDLDPDRFVRGPRNMAGLLTNQAVGLAIRLFAVILPVASTDRNEQ